MSCLRLQSPFRHHSARAYWVQTGKRQINLDRHRCQYRPTERPWLPQWAVPIPNQWNRTRRHCRHKMTMRHRDGQTSNHPARLH